MSGNTSPTDTTSGSGTPAVGGTTAVVDTDQQPQNISGYSDLQLKALLDEAITYKNPKDLANKSETFKELLKRAQTEEKSMESNFVNISFSSSVGGGSLQDIFESGNSEPRKSTGSSNSRRSHNYGRNYNSGYGGSGAGGGGGSYHRQSAQHGGRGHGDRSFVSSRQGEGGSLPSNVHTRYVEEPPFIAEIAAGPNRRTQKSTSTKSEEGPASTAPFGGIRAQMADWSSNGTVIIDMGDSGAEEQQNNDQTAKKVTSHQQTQQRTNSKTENDQAKPDAEGGSKAVKSWLSHESGAPFGNGTSNGIATSANARSELAMSSYEHVDKTIKLSLEPKCLLDPLANLSMKNGRGDQKSEMIITQTYRESDREMANDPTEWMSRPVNLLQQKRFKQRRKYERNMTTIVSDDIVGFRGEEEDLDRLVQFIDGKEDEQQGKTHQSQDRKGRNKGAGKKEHQQGKLKKSNSMNELRSCSKLDEITSEKADSGTVLLRSKAGKNGKLQHDANGKSQDAKGLATVPTSSSSTTIATSGSKRGDRRSWGTEELQYLGDSEAAGGDSTSTGFIVDTNNNNSGASKKKCIGVVDKKVSMPEKTVPLELAIHTKTLGDLPVNSVSMESLVSGSWANEFHVVTKKRKSKKKQNILVQPFEVERRNGGKLARTPQNVEQMLGGSQKNAKNRPNNLIASITNTPSSCSTGTRMAPTNSRGHAQSKSRRKSTSSVPPSEHSDSDLDSVHSLPIESPSTAKAKSAANAPVGASISKVAANGVSYADIAKTISHSQKSPPGNVANGVVGETIDRDTKWPTIGAAPVVEPLAKPSGTEDRLQKMSDVIKNSPAAVVRSTEVINVVSSAQNFVQTPGSLLGEGAKAVLQKSKSVDNESTGFNMNIDQYPSLEKSVHKKTTTTTSAASLATISKDSPPPVAAMLPNGTAGKKVKLLSSIVSDAVNNNHQTSIAGETISPSQFASKAKGPPKAENASEVSEVAAESAMAVKTENHASVDFGEVGESGEQSQLRSSSQLPVKKSAKSNRNRTSSVPNTTSSSTGTSSAGPSRPAVIILNDAVNESNDLTFGFDVNQLLFGDFEEDEIRFLEPGTSDDSASGKNGDQINTSDYNSYDSSLCSTASGPQKESGRAPPKNSAVEHPEPEPDGLDIDNNNNPSDDTGDNLEVPPVSQPQSTPKQQVVNCTNCTRSTAAVNSAAAQKSVGATTTTLMKNSCVQTSLDNLMSVPELSGSGVVVTVSDLESRNRSSASLDKGELRPEWADAGAEEEGEGGTENEEGFDTIKAKLHQIALVNAKFAREAPMGWMCNQMNSFFNNHENVINFVGLAWEDLTHNKSKALKYYDGH